MHHLIQYLISYGYTTEQAERRAVEIIAAQNTHETVTVTPEMILYTVSECWHITPEQLRSKRRDKENVIARQMYMYLHRKLFPSCTLVAIGRVVNIDHATVIYGCRQAQNYIDTNDRLFMTVYVEVCKKLGIKTI